MRNVRLDICYDGSRYRGWQRLSNCDNTIQTKLETALSRILEEPIEIIGSGRTDAGTHAMYQVANFHCSNAMPAEEILEKLRKYLPEDIGSHHSHWSGSGRVRVGNGCVGGYSDARLQLADGYSPYLILLCSDYSAADTYLSGYYVAYLAATKGQSVAGDVHPVGNIAGGNDPLGDKITCPL